MLWVLAGGMLAGGLAAGPAAVRGEGRADAAAAAGFGSSVWRSPWAGTAVRFTDAPAATGEATPDGPAVDDVVVDAAETKTPTAAAERAMLHRLVTEQAGRIARLETRMADLEARLTRDDAGADGVTLASVGEPATEELADPALLAADPRPRPGAEPRTADAELRRRADVAAAVLVRVQDAAERYREEHGGAWPRFLSAGWAPLRRPADASGRGPYLAAEPVNPFNGKSRIDELDTLAPDTGWVWDADAGRLRCVVPGRAARTLGLAGRDGYVAY